MKTEIRPEWTQEKLINYFSKRLQSLVPALNPTVLNRGLGCTAASRLIVMDMGGPSVARIWWVETDAHAFVIRNGQNDKERAYNDSLGLKRTVGYVRSHGEDYTDEYYRYSWSFLNLK